MCVCMCGWVGVRDKHQGRKREIEERERDFQWKDGANWDKKGDHGGLECIQCMAA